MYKLVAKQREKRRMLSTSGFSPPREPHRVAKRLSDEMLALKERVTVIQEEAETDSLLSPKLVDLISREDQTLATELIQLDAVYRVSLQGEGSSEPALLPLAKMLVLVGRVWQNLSRALSDEESTPDPDDLALFAEITKLFVKIREDLSCLFMDVPDRTTAGYDLFKAVRGYCRSKSGDDVASIREASAVVVPALDCTGFIGLVVGLSTSDEEMSALVDLVSVEDLSSSRVFWQLPVSERPNPLTEASKKACILGRTRLREWAVLHLIDASLQGRDRNELERKRGWIMRLNESDLPRHLREELTLNHGVKDTIAFFSDLSRLSRSSALDRLLEHRPITVLPGLEAHDLMLIFNSLRPYDCAVFDSKEDRLQFFDDYVLNIGPKTKESFCRRVAVDLDRNFGNILLDSHGVRTPQPESSGFALARNLIDLFGSPDEKSRASHYVSSKDGEMTTEGLLLACSDGVESLTILQQVLLTCCQVYLNSQVDMATEDLHKIQRCIGDTRNLFVKSEGFVVTIAAKEDGVYAQVSFSQKLTYTDPDEDLGYDRPIVRPLMRMKLSVEVGADGRLDYQAVEGCSPFGGVVMSGLSEARSKVHLKTYSSLLFQVDS